MLIFFVAFIAWLAVFTYGSYPSTGFHWFYLVAAGLAAVMYTAFGVSVHLSVQLLSKKLPPQFTIKNIAPLVFGLLLLHSLFAGILSLIGVWPHSNIWYLGLFAFCVA